MLNPRGRSSKVKIILVAGTNGKTTTSKLIRTILEENGYKVAHNEGGANLLNGIASALIQNASVTRKLNFDYAIFEIDENTLPLALSELTPDFLVILNLFRDQLDRYGEINIIAEKWRNAIERLPKTTSLLLNADDPQIAYLSQNTKAKVSYFGIENKNSSANQNAADSILCPKCSSKLEFKTVFFSHLGDWGCKNCGLKRPKPDMSSFSKYPLEGIYNQYNTNAAVLVAKLNNINNLAIQQSFESFSPAFGRQEKLNIEGKAVQIFLSKNPTSFNESLRTVVELGGKNILFVLNDKIPDGRDVSWIWDTNLEEFLSQFKSITVSGDRTFDMALRVKYANSSELGIKNYELRIKEKLKNAISLALEATPQNETLYILPTYSAMLEVRKILTGKKIL